MSPERSSGQAVGRRQAATENPEFPLDRGLAEVAKRRRQLSANVPPYQWEEECQLFNQFWVGQPEAARWPAGACLVILSGALNT